MQIRIGTVTDINSSNKTVRVFFNEQGIVSDWLNVISSMPAVSASGAEITVSAWFPRIGETVFCLYQDGFNADGYVIGGMN